MHLVPNSLFDFPPNRFIRRNSQHLRLADLKVPPFPIDIDSKFLPLLSRRADPADDLNVCVAGSREFFRNPPCNFEYLGFASLTFGFAHAGRPSTPSRPGSSSGYGFFSIALRLSITSN